MTDPILEHFRDTRNAGELADAHGIGQAGEPGCGAQIRIFLKFSGERVQVARFLASGFSAAIAAASMVTGRITGKSWRQAATLAPADITASLNPKSDAERFGQVSPAANIAIDALHAALEDAIKRGNFPAAKAIDENGVLVAMSGGVDSSVACLLKKREGKQVTGITMRLWSDPSTDSVDSSGRIRPSCCSPQAIRDARAVCHGLGLPHLTVDLREEFEQKIVDDFVDQYRGGRTPNPCARCNGLFRFPKLTELAQALGAARVATGHYARIAAKDGKPIIARGADPSKDQSYMLWAVAAPLLSKLDFPLGGLTKKETRRLAREASLPTHGCAESQEVCFIPDNDYRRFLRTRTTRPVHDGEIVDKNGKRLGSHRGYMDFTVGQRRGLGISAPQPLYVLETIPAKNQVIAGVRDELAVRRIEITGINSFGRYRDDKLVDNELNLQVRYNSAAAPARVAERSEAGWTVELNKPVYGVAPGQSAVLYAGDVIVAGGVIASTGQ